MLGFSGGLSDPVPSPAVLFPPLAPAFSSCSRKAQEHFAGVDQGEKEGLRRGLTMLR